MGRLKFFFAFFIFNAQISFSQGIMSSISKSVGLISFVDNQINMTSNGTGTLIIKPIKDSANVFLVTNKHVLPTFKQNQFIYFRLKDEKAKSGYMEMAFQIFDNNGSFKWNVKLDPDGNDLAIIDVTDFFNQNPDKTYLLNNVMTFNTLANPEVINKNQISIGDEVLFIGYPNVLYDKRNISPLIRTGLLATSPTDDFYFSDEYKSECFNKFNQLIPEKISGFLIDANATGGSSGSLVISKPKIFRMDENRNLQFSKSPYGNFWILGILTTTYYDIDSRLSGLQHLNLGGVIAASQIIKTIELF